MQHRNHIISITLSRDRHLQQQLVRPCLRSVSIGWQTKLYEDVHSAKTSINPHVTRDGITYAAYTLYCPPVCRIVKFTLTNLLLLGLLR